jgi:hypothetical protein
MTFAVSQLMEASETTILFRKSAPHAVTSTELVKLSVGDSAVVQVWARPHVNHTRIAVMEGTGYHFLVPGGQTWTDWFIRCGANGYPHSALSFIQERFQSTKPLPDKNWFALVGAVDSPQRKPFLIGTGTLVCPMPATGELILFANDARCFYWNNFGRIQVIVTRIR